MTYNLFRVKTDIYKWILHPEDSKRNPSIYSASVWWMTISYCTATGLTMFRLHIFRTLKSEQWHQWLWWDVSASVVTVPAVWQCDSQSPVGPGTGQLSSSHVPPICRCVVQHISFTTFRPFLLPKNLQTSEKSWKFSILFDILQKIKIF